MLKSYIPQSLMTPSNLIMIMSFAMPLSHVLWLTMLNNFVVEQANFTGLEIGILQTIREIPGFLSLLVIFVLLVMREQMIAYIALLLLGAATFVVGIFPYEFGLYITTFFLSIGFHYYEVVKKSLTLQWIDKEHTPHIMGKQLSVGALATIITYGIILVANEVLGLNYLYIYMIGGSATIIIMALAMATFPQYTSTPQNKKLFLRRDYWLYYALTFMSGARRQIFVVFAGFLMVEKFGYSLSNITMLYLVNQIMLLYIGPKIGAIIGRIGERHALTIEYIGLIMLFLCYAIVDNSYIAGILYIIDHVFFTFAIAIQTYFQKIARKEDIASTMGVSFSINHIAAVIIPFSFGFLWLYNHSIVFILGAIFACVSLILALCIPRHPTVNNTVTLPIYTRKDSS